MMDSRILLCTLNSSYQHASFGLRYLKANLKELEPMACLLEFTIAQNPRDIVEKILLHAPTIVGFGVYIWNTDETLKTISLLKKVAPEILIVLGGPEISHKTESQPHFIIADYVIKGEADFHFYNLCRSLLNDQAPPKGLITGELPLISEIKLPYHLYSDHDIQNRIIYVEASRGCPYRCEYCLSSLDLTVRNIPLPAFLEAMQGLVDRGARTFKFVDRTFNLNPRISTQILDFFLSHVDKGLFLHFEMVPDRLPDELKVLIEKFPKGALQFEIGVQTWNPQVAANVSRRQDYNKIKQNLGYLRQMTGVHTHVDLIGGLPGESLQSFSEGFDQLAQLEPDEIQVGLLKKLKGAPISRHDQTFQMVYADESPFQIIKNKDINYFELQSLARFSRFWDLIANSGQFPTTLKYLKGFAEQQGESFFWRFMDLMEFLSQRHGQSHGIALLNLTESLWNYLVQKLQVPDAEAANLITQDYSVIGKRDIPKFLRADQALSPKSQNKKLAIPSRQRRHLAGSLP